MKKVSVRDRILDISVNLARIGNWSADSYQQKEKLIKYFLDQTGVYINEVKQAQLSSDVKPVFNHFIIEFQKLKQEKISKKNKDWWAERALTWANILQHRAQLA